MCCIVATVVTQGCIYLSFISRCRSLGNSVAMSSCAYVGLIELFVCLSLSVVNQQQ